MFMDWIVQILLVCGYEILWLIKLLYFNAKQYITLLNVRGDVNSWVTVAHEH